MISQKIEELIWQGKARFKTQTGGIGQQFFIDLPKQSHGIITGLHVSPLTFDEQNQDQLFNALLETIWISDQKKANPIQIKPFFKRVTKQSSELQTTKPVFIPLYIPFEEQASLYFQDYQGAVQLKSVGVANNQTIRDGLEPAVEAWLQEEINAGGNIPSLNQQYWINELYLELQTLGVLGNTQGILIFGNDSGNERIGLRNLLQPNDVKENKGFLSQVNAFTTSSGGNAWIDSGFTNDEGLFQAGDNTNGVYLVSDDGTEPSHNVWGKAGSNGAIFGYHNGSGGLIWRRQANFNENDPFVPLTGYVAGYRFASTRQLFKIDGTVYSASRGLSTNAQRFSLAGVEAVTSQKTMGGAYILAHWGNTQNDNQGILNSYQTAFENYYNNYTTPAPASEVLTQSEAYFTLQYIELEKSINGKLF